MFAPPTSRTLRASSVQMVDLMPILQPMPKIELHRHLEGSLRLETLQHIALEHGVDLPSYDLETLRPYVQVTDGYQPAFHNFLEKFKLLRRFYTTRKAIERIAYEAVADAATDNVKYLELRFNPVALSRVQGFRLEDVMDWVCASVARAQDHHDIIARLIVSIKRDEPETAGAIVEAAIKRKKHGIVAFDISGDEVNFTLEPFVPIFRRARQAGLGLTVHAGEAGSARNVREALELIKPERIGHGVHCIEDSNVVKLVRDSGVTLEVCPTSNLQTGVVHLMSHHPLPDLYGLGLKLTINTDDPSVSDTTLTDEYRLVVAGMSMSLNDLKRMILNAAEVAFLPDEERAALVARFRAELGI
jgi:adenosine deaminase